ncbi:MULTISPECIES: hypothetical protein [Bacillus cereus group]|nr:MULTISPECIES: hypothetical protein [Bacillus cereus group]EEL50954.1 GCN5-related N-acetyltransferase [Bacillus cereus Rock3-44]
MIQKENEEEVQQILNFAQEMYKEFGFIERQVVMTLKQEKYSWVHGNEN